MADEALIATTDDEAEPELRRHVAAALAWKGSALGEQGRNEEALSVYDDLAARYQEADKPELQRQVAFALAAARARLG